MSMTLVFILIVVVAVVIAGGAALFFGRRQRSRRLHQTFGSEYDREVAGSNRGAAEKDLRQRQKRHSAFDIRPLEDAERDRYRRSWDQLQSQFVDSPANAVREADILVISIMRTRGYPTDDFDQRAQDISVEHPEVVQHYRDAHRVAVAQQSGDAGTEELRKAAISYRSLVTALLHDKPDNTQQHRTGTANPPTPTNETRPRAGRSSAEHASTEDATTTQGSPT